MIWEKKCLSYGYSLHYGFTLDRDKIKTRLDSIQPVLEMTGLEHIKNIFVVLICVKATSI